MYLFSSLKDTLTVGADHTFGILIKPDEYGVGDLLHQRAPGNYLRGKERIRGVVASIRQHLKKANFHNFNDLLSAFRFYDKVGVQFGIYFNSPQLVNPRNANTNMYLINN